MCFQNESAYIAEERSFFHKLLPESSLTKLLQKLRPVILKFYCYQPAKGPWKICQGYSPKLWKKAPHFVTAKHNHGYFSFFTELYLNVDKQLSTRRKQSRNFEDDEICSVSQIFCFSLTGVGSILHSSIALMLLVDVNIKNGEHVMILAASLDNSMSFKFNRVPSTKTMLAEGKQASIASVSRHSDSSTFISVPRKAHQCTPINHLVHMVIEYLIKYPKL